MKHSEKVIEEKIIYEGKILSLKQNKVELENGKITSRDIIHHNGAVCVLAITDENEVLMVKQFRLPFNDELLELPAGKLEINENPLDAAKRELEEETGYRSDDIKQIGKMYPTCGYSDEIIYLYFAKNLIKTVVNPDEDEFLSLKKIKYDKLMEMIKNGEIPDAKTQLTALLYNQIL